MRVLHVLGGLGAGGAEGWLVELLAPLRELGVHCELVVNSSRQEHHTDRVRAMGVSIHVIPYTGNPVAYACAFRRLLHERPGVGIVHSHMYNFSAVPLWVAAGRRIPGRILHVHTDGESKYDRRRWSPVRALARLSALAAASHGIAVSNASGRRYFGERWGRDPRFALLHCGVDTARLTCAIDRGRLRASLGIPAGSAVLGHVGRLAPVKNQRFLLHVFDRFRQTQPDARLLIIGDGPERKAIEAEVGRLGLTGAVRLLGVRTDVPELLRGVIDVFLLPSRHEGLPLSLVEAQLAGRRCIVSDAVTDEAVIRGELVVRLPLDEAEDVWVRHIAEAVDRRLLVGQVGRAPTGILADWSVEASARRLAAFYRSVLRGVV